MFHKRFSIREWNRIQDDVHTKVWHLRVEEGEEVAMSYVPTREEFGLPERRTS